MTALARTLVVAEMQARELLRRRVAMALFVLLPAMFFYSIPAEEDYGVVAGAIGVSWAVSAAGMFGILGWRRVDQRLALAGARPRDGMLGRLLVGVTLAAALVAVYAPLILARSTAVQDVGTYVVSLGLLAVVSVPLGLLIGVLLPRELEGTLVLIGIVGVESSIPPDASLAAFLPLYGPLDVLQVAGGFADDPVTGGVVHALSTTVLLAAGAYLLWRRRVPIAGAR